MRKITSPKHPNADQIGTEVQYRGEPHRITDVGGGCFTLVRLRDGYAQNVRIAEVNGRR
ncbi:hypothetical protein [Streptomyces sp. Ru72]|uniref:hypothetical protein n=1 Tax=Streptomyces sp. Ru72 TaxID=2080747 RepID=UPI0015E32BA2|nr:hypothetical protein [Streptomyces sp. Ru72]